MAVSRSALCGPPHTYVVSVSTALGLPRLAESGACSCLLQQMEQVRKVFDAYYYGWNILPDSFQLIIRHRSGIRENEGLLLRRWAQLGGKTTPRADHLAQRLTSLSGFMQTLLQTAAHQLRRHCGGPGTWWAPRYRSCLLSDDSALIAATAGVEYVTAGSQALSSSREQHQPHESTPHLSALPLSLMPDGEVLPRDATPMGIKPPPPSQNQDLLNHCLDQWPAESAAIYHRALQRAWALGRPESLSETLARLGRSGGRGRSRRLRELDDEWGLCGVWG